MVEVVDHSQSEDIPGGFVPFIYLYPAGIIVGLLVTGLAGLTGGHAKSPNQQGFDVRYREFGIVVGVIVQS